MSDSPRHDEHSHPDTYWIEDTPNQDEPMVPIYESEPPRDRSASSLPPINSRPGTASDFEHPSYTPSILGNAKVAPEEEKKKRSYHEMANYIANNLAQCQVVAAKRGFMGFGNRAFSLFQRGKRILVAKKMSGFCKTKVFFANTLRELNREEYIAELIPIKRGFILKVPGRSEEAIAAFELSTHHDVPAEILTVALNECSDNTIITQDALQRAIKERLFNSKTTPVLESKAPLYKRGGKLSLAFIGKSALSSCYNLVINDWIERNIDDTTVESAGKEKPEEIVLQFGKCEGGTYFLDYKSKFSSLQAFALAIVRLL